MKKLLFFLMAFCLTIFHLKAQIIITGFMADPRGRDADAPGSVTEFGATGTQHIGGFEYVQLMATEDINFSIKNYALVIGRNSGSGMVTANGWAEGGGQTFKFNLTEGQVSKGEFFYVGGLEKRIAGYKNQLKSTDISETAPITSNRAKWIRAININGGGDDFGTKPNTSSGLMNTEYAFSIGVFDTKSVLSSTKPIDAVFFAKNEAASEFLKYNAADNIIRGYLIPESDYYSSNNDESPYFFQGNKNQHYFITENLDTNISSWVENYGYFCKLGGVYNTTTKKWATPRAATYDRLVLDGASENTHTEIPLSRIQSTNGITVLPVKLVSFTGKKQNGSIVLNWNTASEDNNGHFDVYRSSSAEKDFKLITTVIGKGTTTDKSDYSFVDNMSSAGVNYYKLIQVDNDGTQTPSEVIFVNNGLDEAFVKVYTSERGIDLSINSLKGGKAELSLTNLKGQVMVSKEINLDKGVNAFNYHVLLSPGIYIITVKTQFENLTAKTVL